MEKFYKSLICFSLASSNFLIAQEMHDTSCENPCYDMWMLPDCQHGEREATLSAQHREANGIGYNRGYSSLDFFWNLPSQSAFHPFIDLRGHITNDGLWAANAGLGLRRYFCCADLVLGGNIFYDYRNAPHIGFHQIGGGLEAFSCKWDIHLNGYFPIGRKKKLIKDGFYKFDGHRALFQKRYEFSMTGGELGIGYEVFTSDYVNIHTKVGGYYFHGRFDKQAGGGLFRLKSDITPYFSIEGQVSYDSLFKDIYQGMASLNWPIGKRAQKNTTYSCNRRTMQMVDRFEMIVSKKHRKKTPAINPITGQPLNFIFVNNTSSSSGTFDSPYPTLVQAQNASNPSDVIYVFPGDGTTNGMNQGVTLQTNQQLLGSGTPALVLTRFGLRTIPAQTTTMPTITSPNNVVTLAPGAVGNVISGFNIQYNSSTTGIFSSSTTIPIQNLTVINNNFNDLSAGGGFGVNIINPLGNFLIANNTFTKTDIAILVTWSTFTVTPPSTTQLNIFNNQIIANAVGILINPGVQIMSNSIVNYDISFNKFQGTSIASVFTEVSVDQLTSTLMLNGIAANNIDNQGGYDFILHAASPGLILGNLSLINNISTNAVAPSSSFTINLAGDTFIDLDMEGNQFLNATNSAFFMDGGHMTLNLVNNNSTVANNAAEGFAISNSTGFPLTIISPNGQLSGVAAQNTGSSPLANSDTTKGPITTSGTIDYDLPQN